MSSILPLPNTLGQIEPPKDYYFVDRIPRLKDLLPKLRGQPGFVYAQICLQNGRRAQDEGWSEVANTVIYTIRGPKGEVNCKLYAQGKSIPGQSHASGKRVCLVDDEVELITGLEIQPGLNVEVKDAGTVEVTSSKESAQEVEVQTSGGVSAEQREPALKGSTGKTKA